MPPPVKRNGTPPKNIVAQILLGEAAGEGEEGLRFVRDVLVNRMRAQGKSLEEVATAPAQFSASARPDLAEFYAKQPTVLQVRAQELVNEAQAPGFTPQYPEVQHYVTSDLWEKRGTLSQSHWLRKMQKVGQVGHHVLLKEAQ